MLFEVAIAARIQHQRCVILLYSHSRVQWLSGLLGSKTNISKFERKTQKDFSLLFNLFFIHLKNISDRN